MSSKHLAILRGKVSLNVADTKDDDDEIQDSVQTLKTSANFSAMLALSDDDESDEDTVEQPQTATAEKLLTSDPSDEISSEDIKKEVVGEKKSGHKKKSSKGKRKQKSNNKHTQSLNPGLNNDDDDILEEILQDRFADSENNRNCSNIDDSCTSKLFHVDIADLDINSVLRRRFGAQVINNGDGLRNRRNGGEREANKRKISNRRLVFGAPKDDWPKPPSFIGGGIGMDFSGPPTYYNHVSQQTGANMNWFTLTWSKEYQKLYQEFQRVQDTGDANRLVTFLSQHPYLVEGLLQLAMVFARTGHMDRANDLVRRSLYCLECSFVESFKSNLTFGNCRIDSSKVENSALFIALFRHMQFSAMLGCSTVAADICRLLLSLDPISDPMHSFLSLDHYLLVAGEYDRVTDFFESKLPLELTLLDMTSNSNIMDQTIVETNNEVNPVMDNNYLTTKCKSDRNDNEIDNNNSSGSSNNNPMSIVTISHLPGWSYSIALAHYLKITTTTTTTALDSHPPDTSSATSLLMKAVTEFPFIIVSLIDFMSTAEKSSVTWKTIAGHRFITTLQSKLSENSSVLLHLALIYATRNISLWKRPGCISWLAQITETMLKTVDTLSSTDYEMYFNNLWTKLSMLSEKAAIRRYRAALPEDFGEEFPRLPPEANPLDPRLLDPRLLAPGGGNLALQLVAMGELPVAGQGRAMMMMRGRQNIPMAIPQELVQALRAGVLNEDAFLQEVQREFGLNADDLANLREQLLQHQLNGRNRDGAARIGNLDPDMPLLQLFWQTFLPWNEFNDQENIRNIH